jgi:hypothetical protein
MQIEHGAAFATQLLQALVADWRERSLRAASSSGVSASAFPVATRPVHIALRNLLVDASKSNAAALDQSFSVQPDSPISKRWPCKVTLQYDGIPLPAGAHPRFARAAKVFQCEQTTAPPDADFLRLARIRVLAFTNLDVPRLDYYHGLLPGTSLKRSERGPLFSFC